MQMLLKEEWEEYILLCMWSVKVNPPTLSSNVKSVMCTVNYLIIYISALSKKADTFVTTPTNTIKCM